MTCANREIREMLPSFLDGSLDADGTALVRGHIARCGECFEELELLRSMADAEVPDPGEAFWASLPDRVYGDVRRARAEERPRSWWKTEWWSGMPLRGAVAFAVVVLVAWVLIEPAHRTRQEPVGRTPAVAVEDLYGGPSDVADLATADITLLNDWLEQGLAELRQDLGRMAMSANVFGRTLDEDLSSMDREELEDVVAALSRKQEV